MRPDPRSVILGERRAGPGEPVFVIAEAGVNHNGDAETAHALVDTAADAGADAVKFQTFDPDAVVSATGSRAPYQQRGGSGDSHSMLSDLVLPHGVWSELAAHAAERGVMFLSTAFDPVSLELLLDIDVPALKVPSGEIDNLPFLRLIADSGRPVMLSTGLATMAEVDAAVMVLGQAPGVVVLHCVTAYPAPVEASNLRAMRAMGDRLDVPVGWSDHTLGSVTSVAAVALGACVLEKHLTLDRTMAGPDHAASADPHELEQYVRDVRAAESSLGTGTKGPAEVELENLPFVRRSHHATRDLERGAVLRAEDTVLLRPMGGLPPSIDVVGRTLRRDVRAGQPLVEEDLR